MVMQMITMSTNLGGELAHRLTMALESHNRVVWLVPGGSNIAISIEAMAQLDAELTKKLVILQTDERYVPLDSSDCNWKQLCDRGFDSKQARAYPMLTDDASRDEVVQRYMQVVVREFATADYIIGQFGIGADGHIAGIKPRSLASMTQELVVGYQAEDFNRVTLTFTALSQLNEAVTFMFGADKQPVLDKLADGTPYNLAEFPAGIIQPIAVSTVYNDYKDK